LPHEDVFTVFISIPLFILFSSSSIVQLDAQFIIYALQGCKCIFKCIYSEHCKNEYATDYKQYY